MSHIIGIDVSKASLDCAYLRDEDQQKVQRRTCQNEVHCFAPLVAWAEARSCRWSRYSQVYPRRWIIKKKRGLAPPPMGQIVWTLFTGLASAWSLAFAGAALLGGSTGITLG